MSSCFRSALQKDVSNGPAILTLAHTGEKVDVHAIKPTKAQAMFDRMDIDGVIHEHDDPISSGSLSFREVIKIYVHFLTFYRVLRKERLNELSLKQGENGEHGKGMRKVG